MTEREGGETTAELADAILRSYRDRKAAERAEDVGAEVDLDVEGQADALADTAARLAGLLAALTARPHRSLDAIAVFRDLSRAAGSIADAAGELRRQEWFDLDDQEALQEWEAALAGLRSAEAAFGHAADGWI